MSDEDLPEIVRESLKQLSPEDAKEAARTYREATEEEREGMVAFLEGDGPETMRQLHVEREDGTPTSDELERWVEGEGRDPRVDPKPGDRLRIDGVEHRVVRPEDLDCSLGQIARCGTSPIVCSIRSQGGAGVFGLGAWRSRAAGAEVLEVARGQERRG